MSYIDTEDLSLNNLSVTNLVNSTLSNAVSNISTNQSNIATNSSDLTNKVIRRDTKSQQPLTSDLTDGSKNGLSFIASHITFGSNTISDGSTQAGSASGITFSDGSRMTKLTDAKGQQGNPGQTGAQGPQGEQGIKGKKENKAIVLLGLKVNKEIKDKRETRKKR